MILRFTVTVLLFCPFLCFSNEGLWLPLHLKRLQGVDLQKMGMQLTPEEIYSVNSSSLKDAIASFNGNCTASVVSKSGLILTNYHCAYPAIQSANQLNSQIFTNGFWADTNGKEIPSRETSVSFLVRMEDVTKEVLGQIKDPRSEKDREEQIKRITTKLEDEEIKDTHYNAVVKSFFSGNEYYIFIYETFEDLRIVGVPPETIGRFGGELDNWEWPRHTGDFAFFRIYAKPNGIPSEYDSENTPLKSTYHLPISIAGVQKGDQTLVMGYPAKTQRYLTSSGVRFLMKNTMPDQIKINKYKTEVLGKIIKQDPAVGRKYGALQVDLNNLGKYYVGKIEGVQKLKVIEEKLLLEKEFKQWSHQNASIADEASLLLDKINELYLMRKQNNLYNIYLVDGVFSSETLFFAYHFSGLIKPLTEKYPPNAFQEKISKLKKLSQKHFRSYIPYVDQEMTTVMMSLFYHNIPKEQHPEILEIINKKYKGDFSEWGNALFQSSMFANPKKVDDFLNNPTKKKLSKDPVYQVVRGFLDHYFGNIASPLKENSRQLNTLQRNWMKALTEMNPQLNNYPDANGTLRVSWGKVREYQNFDGQNLPFQTTLYGLIKKSESGKPEFEAPEKLINLYRSKHYGMYGLDGKMPLGFITDTDISSGNSGSPVLNHNGALIGMVFDGNKESLTGDLSYNLDSQRSINLDIRFVLFMVDYFASANHLIEEMTILETPKPSEPEIPINVPSHK